MCVCVERRLVGGSLSVLCQWINGRWELAASVSLSGRLCVVSNHPLKTHIHSLSARQTSHFFQHTLCTVHRPDTPETPQTLQKQVSADELCLCSVCMRLLGVVSLQIVKRRCVHRC